MEVSLNGARHSIRVEMGIDFVMNGRKEAEYVKRVGLQLLL